MLLRALVFVSFLVAAAPAGALEVMVGDAARYSFSGGMTRYEVDVYSSGMPDATPFQVGIYYHGASGTIPCGTPPDQAVTMTLSAGAAKRVTFTQAGLPNVTQSGAILIDWQCAIVGDNRSNNKAPFTAPPPGGSGQLVDWNTTVEFLTGPEREVYHVEVCDIGGASVPASTYQIGVDVDYGSGGPTDCGVKPEYILDGPAVPALGCVVASTTVDGWANKAFVRTHVDWQCHLGTGDWEYAPIPFPPTDTPDMAAMYFGDLAGPTQDLSTGTMDLAMTPDLSTTPVDDAGPGADGETPHKDGGSGCACTIANAHPDPTIPCAIMAFLIARSMRRKRP